MKADIETVYAEVVQILTERGLALTTPNLQIVGTELIANKYKNDKKISKEFRQKIVSRLKNNMHR